MIELVQGEATVITFVMVDAAGNEVAGLGGGFALQLSRNGSAFQASAGVKAEIGSGWYFYQLTAVETNTLGPLSIIVTGGGAVQQNLLYQVVSEPLGAADVWSHEPRTVTMPATQLASLVHGNDIQIVRGDTLLFTLTGLGSLAGWQKVWWTVKADKDLKDSQAAVQVVGSNPPDPGDGLLYLNRAIGNLGNGSISVTDTTYGTIIVTLEAVETAKLLITGKFYYDLQILTGAGIRTVAVGRVSMVGDVTRAV